MYFLLQPVCGCNVVVEHVSGKPTLGYMWKHSITYNWNIWEVGASGSGVQGWPQLPSEFKVYLSYRYLVQNNPTKHNQQQETKVLAGCGAHACDFSTGEAEAGRTQVYSRPELYNNQYPGRGKNAVKGREPT